MRYEKVQADIFDHVMAMLDLFDLRAYQRDGHLSLLAHREQSVCRNSPESDNAPEDAQEKSEANR